MQQSQAKESKQREIGLVPWLMLPSQVRPKLAVPDMEHVFCFVGNLVQVSNRAAHCPAGCLLPLVFYIFFVSLWLLFVVLKLLSVDMLRILCWQSLIIDNIPVAGVKLEEPGQQHVLGSMQPEAQSAVQGVHPKAKAASFVNDDDGMRKQCTL